MSHLQTHNNNCRHHHYRYHAHHRLLHKQAIGVYSEAGKLDVVLMHRPGRELERLTPGNKDLLLFNDIPNVNDTHNSHDAFANALRKEHVQVLYETVLILHTRFETDGTYLPSPSTSF